MLLTRHRTKDGPRWALDGSFLPPSLTLSTLLEMPSKAIFEFLGRLSGGEAASGEEVAPIDPEHEVWAAGVTYLRSRDARREESSVANMYDRVYEATRPELFFKSLGWRVAGTGMPIRIRADSHWNVPEPELVLVVNCQREIVGYCAGNDVSSRDIEGENPLYLPQAKVYRHSCALGPAITVEDGTFDVTSLAIRLDIQRDDAIVYSGETSTSQIHRRLADLAAYLGRYEDFPQGAVLLTGTGIVPEDTFSLQDQDQVIIEIEQVGVLRNAVQQM